ncbi:MAG: tetratricopeptide repeat protein [Candidatus Obscuribacterales bacterium]|nr:tetratricopeptide repeat protein [Candidatus Obscuribacterales bacterium]
MRRTDVVRLTLSLALFGLPFFRQSVIADNLPPVFPGRGSRLEWTKAVRFSSEAAVQFENKRVDHAIAKMQRAVSLYAYDSALYQQLGDYLYEASDYSNAGAQYEKAIELDPKFVEAYNKLGLVNEKLGLVSLAEKNFRKALVLQSKNFNASLHLGNLLFNTKRFDEAKRVLEQAAKLPDADKKKVSDALWHVDGALRSAKKPTKADRSRIKVPASRS